MKIRAVNGDVVPPVTGLIDGHDHVVVGASKMTEMFGECLLDSVDAAIYEVERFRDAGGRLVVDMTPPSTGRDATNLRVVSRNVLVDIVAATGRHIERFCDDDDPMSSLPAESLATIFKREIESSCEDERAARAGVIKVGTEHPVLTRFERITLEAAAIASIETGCPIVTHTRDGDYALSQVEFLLGLGVGSRKIMLSHMDRSPDLEYHREVLSTGVLMCYDNFWRSDSALRASLELVVAILGENSRQLVLGMDLARRSQRVSFDGWPGIQWIAQLPQLLANAGVAPPDVDCLVRDNAARFFAWVPGDWRPEIVNQAC